MFYVVCFIWLVFVMSVFLICLLSCMFPCERMWMAQYSLIILMCHLESPLSLTHSLTELFAHHIMLIHVTAVKVDKIIHSMRSTGHMQACSLLRPCVSPTGLATVHFYPRDAMLARVIEIATCLFVCLSVCLSVRPSRAGIVSKRRKLASWFLHHLVAPRL